MACKGAFFVFLLLGCLSFMSVEALQCYDCSNCEDGEDFNELQICGGLPPTIRPTRQTTTTTQISSTTTPSENSTKLNSTVAGNSTLSSVADEDSDYSDEESEELVVRPANTTLRPGNIRTSTRTTTTTTTTTRSIRTTRTTTTTTKRPAANETESEEADGGDSDYDVDYADTDRRMRRRNQMFSRVDDAVCYMVKFRANNDTIITKRGCATMVRANNVLTCQSIVAGEELYDCQLCNTNGCNKFAEQDGDWDVLWNAAGKVQSSVWFIISLFITLPLWKY